MYQIKEMTTEYMKEIFEWRYEEAYQLYNLMKTPEMIQELSNGKYYCCVSDGQLVGYFAFGSSARIPAVESNPYAEDLLDIGLGLRPDLCGKGYGAAFLKVGMEFAGSQWSPKGFRLTVAEFNRRAIKAYKKAGFSVVRSLSHMMFDMKFLVMMQKDTVMQKTLYFEDDERDANYFAEELKKEVYPEAIIEDTKAFLAQYGIDWIKNYEDAESAIKSKKEYDTFVLDIVVDGKSENGLNLVRMLKKIRQYEKADLWICSRMGYLQRHALSLLQNGHFVHKDDMGVLCKEIAKKIKERDRSVQWEEEKVLLDTKDGSKQVSLNDIIYIKSKDEKFCVYVYQPGGYVAQEYICYKASDIIDKVRNKDKLSGSERFLTIAKGVLVNVEMIDQPQMINGQRMLKMRQCPESLKLGRSFIGAVEQILGERSFRDSRSFTSKDPSEE